MLCRTEQPSGAVWKPTPVTVLQVCRREPKPLMPPHNPVLILDGPGRIAVAVARCLHRHGIPVDAARFRSTATPGLCSRAIRNRFVLPDFAEDPGGFLAATARLIEAGGYDLLIPASDGALAAVQACYEPLARLATPACPPPHIVARVLDKTATLSAAAECGIPVPREWRPATGGPPPFQLVAKPASKAGASPFRARHILAPEDLRAVLREIAGREGDFLFQEYCPGEGAGVEALMWQGEPLALFQHRRVRENPASGGVSVVAESEPVDPELGRMAVRLLRRIGWSGPAMVEFRRNRDASEVALMEVNGRYWGSLALPCALGVEFPYYHWQLIHGTPPAIPHGYAAGARVRWTSGEFMRLKALAADWAGGRSGFPALCREAARCCLALAPGWASDAMSVRGDRWPGMAELWFIATRRLRRASGGAEKPPAAA